VGSFGVSPPSPGQLRYLTSGGAYPEVSAAPSRTAQEASKLKPSPPVSGRRATVAGVMATTTLSTGESAKPSPPTTARRTGGSCRETRHSKTNAAADVLASLPTPARRTAERVSVSSKQPELGSSSVPSEPPQQRQQQQQQQQQQLPTPRLAPEQAGSSVAVAASYDRLPAAEPDQQASPAQEPRTAAHIGCAIWQPPAERHLHDRAPIDLTQVLNLVAPRPSQSSTAGKQQPPSVAAELLISSALRMQWPRERRRVLTTDAAAFCREAAEVLSEAASQLIGAATLLDDGSSVLTKASGFETRRRRTYGGPSPTRAVSPVGGSHSVLRGSSPHATRPAGLRA